MMKQPPRFTISHHTGAKEGNHFDLLLEHGDSLKTWRLENVTFHFPQTAKQIKDLGEQFEKEEDRLFGEEGFEKTVDQVAAIEKQLGIHDLALFTAK